MADPKAESKAGALWWRLSDGSSMAAVRSRALLLANNVRQRVTWPDDPDDWYQWQLERTKDNAPA